MNYEEKYGERILSDYEERQEEERIKQQDRLEDLEKVIGKIKDMVIETENLSVEEYKELIGEIKWIIKDL